MFAWGHALTFAAKRKTKASRCHRHLARLPHSFARQISHRFIRSATICFAWLLKLAETWQCARISIDISTCMKSASVCYRPESPLQNCQCDLGVLTSNRKRFGGDHPDHWKQLPGGEVGLLLSKVWWWSYNTWSQLTSSQWWWGGVIIITMIASGTRLCSRICFSGCPASHFFPLFGGCPFQLYNKISN